MGIETMGAPWDLVIHLKEKLDIVSFVETGTYHGGTAAIAAESFSSVFTIEAIDSLHEQAVEKFRENPSVTCLLGDTRECLPKAVHETEPKRLYWLDAHWSGGLTYGKNDECPLIDELRIIKEHDDDATILIDDARLFLLPPPAPHRIGAWPNLKDIMTELDENYTIVFNDVIVSVPPTDKDVLSLWAQDRATEIWQAHGKQQKSWANRLKRRLKLS